MSPTLGVIILAAGKGTRMKSERAKVLHEVLFEPMLRHVIAALQGLAADPIVVVTGHQSRAVQAAVADCGVRFAQQEEQLGTGHAVLCAREAVAGVDHVLILCGDTPLLRPGTLEAMTAGHACSGARLTLMTTELPDPTNYGRIIRSATGDIEAIVEEKDASDQERRVTEVNAGIYCVETAFLFDALEQVGTDNSQGEVYLTDIVALARQAGIEPAAYCCVDHEEVIGVNSRVELAAATRVLQRRRNRELMTAGVTMIDPDSVFVGARVRIGRDTTVFPGCLLTGDTEIGERCLLKSGTIIDNCRLAADTVAGPYREYTHQTLG